RGADAVLHRHLDLDLGSPPPAQVRRAGAPAARRPGPGGAMSTFWSAWIMFLVTLNLGITLFLFIWGQRVDIPRLPDGTTGHVWAHGVLREGLRRLPRWWVLFSASTFVIGFGYLVLYP